MKKTIYIGISISLLAAISLHAVASQSEQLSEEQFVISDTQPPTGQIEATFTQEPFIGGKWIAHIHGIYSGTGSNAHIERSFIFGTDDRGKVIGEIAITENTLSSTMSPFETQIAIPFPESNWTQMGFGIDVVDEADNRAKIVSIPFPIISSAAPLIDHAISGTIVEASNFNPSSEDATIPSGIGIQHTLINSLPEGDYYAVVFFKDLTGCPSNNYEINAFNPGHYWGYDIRSLPTAGKAYSSSVGGCMQEFHIDPRKAEPWLWGALSNTGTSSAIADASGTPAFAICSTKEFCDTVVPRMPSTPTPVDTTPQPKKISNVLFLPGIKGSNLYRSIPFCIIGPFCDRKLWLPISNITVPELYMNDDGSSVHTDIYAKESDVLEQAYGQDFYTSFVTLMNNAEHDGTFGSHWHWKSIAYDWRLSIPDIVTNGVENNERITYSNETNTSYIEESLRALASSSPTGKVTIIAHSNGGLVAKALMQKIGDVGAARLIDTIIFIGVPQSGSPRAIGALLYGEREGIPGIQHVPNVIMTSAQARTFAHNAPMAYHLLPSRTYIQDVKDAKHPLITFGSGETLASERKIYGPTITSYAALEDYLLARDVPRSTPDTNDLNSASVGNPLLMQYADSLHTTLDSWKPPKLIQFYEIAGWGRDTISGIELYEQPRKNGTDSKVMYRPNFTDDGDGTVPIPSALGIHKASNIHPYWMDLLQTSNANHTYTHADLLENDDIQTFITTILSDKGVIPASFSTARPNEGISKKRLAFIVHSPVSISLTSSIGSIDAGENTLPTATYGELGETKYILAPAGNDYTLTLRGEDSGEFSLDAEEMEDGSTTRSFTIADVPTLPSTTATLHIHNDLDDASALTVDEDGDGSSDITITPRMGETTYPSSEAISDSPSIALALTIAFTGAGYPSSISSSTEQVLFPEFASTTRHLVGKVLGASTSTINQHNDPASVKLGNVNELSQMNYVPAGSQLLFTPHHPTTNQYQSILKRLWNYIVRLCKKLFERVSH